MNYEMAGRVHFEARVYSERVSPFLPPSLAAVYLYEHV